MHYPKSAARLCVVIFLILPGYALAKAVYHQSFIGILLALVSMGAAVWFFQLLNQDKTQPEKREQSN